jgi:hypothetical protein
MDKQKVIEAYRRGLITLQECGQILGAEKKQLDDLMQTGRLSSQSRSNPFMLADPY